ncbi:hypothetical protein [Bradyrhizobium sp. CCBAU 11386]|uniref:hypothetical protein n=1 Tax=Bradyrhizobium sp. CCBAU 11386 TaxID=1630837 RepID=UPI0023023032|nr:hypothetical protein [Bradyrhizobium sp. CCBAU 11386]
MSNLSDLAKECGAHRSSNQQHALDQPRTIPIQKDADGYLRYREGEKIDRSQQAKITSEHWTPQAGHYPEIAYQISFIFKLVLHIIAWVWFAFPVGASAVDQR